MNVASCGLLEDQVKWAIDRAGPRAVCVATTNATCDLVNEICFDRLRENGAKYFRIFARHDPPLRGDVPKPSGATKAWLLRYDPPARRDASKKGSKADSRYAAPVLDLAVGSRVAVNENIAVELGLYRGSMGTVVGFVFEGKAPSAEERYSGIDDVVDEDEDREIPIVMVQMDEHYNGPSCVTGQERIVPFYARPSRERIRGKYTRYQLPLITAHARTIHRAQGLTASDGLVLAPESGKPKSLGLYYVGVSRCKKASQFF